MMKSRTTLFITVCLFFATSLWANTPFGNQGLSWSLENGVLTISKTGAGTGEMPNFTFGNTHPWYSQKDDVVHLIIEEGVLNIGDYAFEKHTELTSITLPETVRSIGAYAFFCCSGLTSVTLPEGLESIGYRSFHYCTGLTSVIIPSTLTIIRHEDFAGCKNLKEVYSKAYIPPVCNENVFAGIPSDCKLYVPERSRSSYETADTWKDFNIFSDETSIEWIAATTLQIYPNPVEDGFTISGIPGEKIKITLVTISGKVVLSRTIDNDEYISVNTLPAGVYILKIEASDVNVVKKIVIK